MLALAAAVIVAGGLGTAVLRSASGPRPGDGTHPPVTAKTAATPDPRVDEVKAVARQFIEQFWESAKTGDTAAVHMLTEPGTQADGNAGINVTISKTSRANFMASRVVVDESSWKVVVLTQHATVACAYRLLGHDADWPSLRAREVDHETKQLRANFEMELVGKRWLITKYS
jgi:hypothetical protein